MAARLAELGQKVGLYADGRHLPYLSSVVGAVLLWSVSFTATKIALTSIAPLTLGLLRFILATMVLAAVWGTRPALIKPTLPDVGRLVVSGILGITILFAMENTGLKLATASDAALLVASYPAITMILETILFRVPVSWGRFGGVGMAMVGVYLIVGQTLDGGSSHRLLGNLILLGTGVVWACYNFVTRSVVKKYSMFTITFYQTIAGTIAFLPLAWSERAQWHVPSSASLLALVYLGVFCSALAFLLYAYGLRKLSSSSAVALMNLVPVFGVASSVIILAEPVSPAQLLGGVVVIAGVALSVRPGAGLAND